MKGYQSNLSRCLVRFLLTCRRQHVHYVYFKVPAIPIGRERNVFSASGDHEGANSRAHDYVGLISARLPTISVSSRKFHSWARLYRIHELQCVHR